MNETGGEKNCLDNSGGEIVSLLFYKEIVLEIYWLHYIGSYLWY